MKTMEYDVEFPVSFIYGGRHSAEFINTWEKTIHIENPQENVTIRTVRYSDPDTKLAVNIISKIYDDIPAVDWTVYFTNHGSLDTPVIEKVNALDVSIKIPKKEGINVDDAVIANDRKYSPEQKVLPVLKTLKGAQKTDHVPVDDFKPNYESIKHGEIYEFSSESSCIEHSPFFDITWPGGGVITAIGWTGRWCACVEGIYSNTYDVHVTAGMENIHTVLYAGETIRTPRIMQVYWEGDNNTIGSNLFRKTMIEHILPKKGLKTIIPSISCSNPDSNKTNQEIELSFINHHMKNLGVETYWLDAWWIKGGYPAGEGNYTFPIDTPVDTDRFSNGLKPISDAAHSNGYSFLTWFSPENVPFHSTMYKQNPQWVLTSDNRERGSFDLSNPDAVEYMIDFMDSCIKAWNIDIWRTDGGMEYKNIKFMDTDPNRIGIKEIRCFEGLYKFWDSLIEKNPNIYIDNCQGGGTRIDLETCSRAISLWRTDTAVSTCEWFDYNRNAILGQIINASLNMYTPLSQNGSVGTKPYYIRSNFNGGLSFIDDIKTSGFDREEFKQGINECKRLRKYILGNFYCHIFESQDPREWCVYQYHLSTEDEGVVFAFRRHESLYDSATISVKEIKPESVYALKLYETYELKEQVTISGKDLKNLYIRIDSMPGSMLIEYANIQNKSLVSIA